MPPTHFAGTHHGLSKPLNPGPKPDPVATQQGPGGGELRSRERGGCGGGAPGAAARARAALAGADGAALPHAAARAAPGRTAAGTHCRSLAYHGNTQSHATWFLKGADIKQTRVLWVLQRHSVATAMSARFRAVHRPLQLAHTRARLADVPWVLAKLGARGQVEKLQLDSGAYWSCRLPCRADSHVDDEGVAALVDALCRRRRSEGARLPDPAAQALCRAGGCAGKSKGHSADGARPPDAAVQARCGAGGCSLESNAQRGHQASRAPHPVRAATSLRPDAEPTMLSGFLTQSLTRACAMRRAGLRPLALSLCGGTALTHEAAGALLRLPLLTGLRLDACPRVPAMDRLRLAAKVKAGREALAAAGGARCLSREPSWFEPRR